jgi:predicted DNA-binding transcriptional regulator AlpA
MQSSENKSRRIGVLEVAEKLKCHPTSVPRLVRQKRLPPPDKLLNKNVWWESAIDAAIERGLSNVKKVA